MSTRPTRRGMMLFAAALPFSGCATPSGETKPNAIPADALESGDFLFPRNPRANVPYIVRPDQSESEDRAAWEATRAEFLARAAAGRTDLTPAEVKQFRSMTYEQFRNIYDGEPANLEGKGGRISVGHVAIVIRDGANLDVVEALWGDIGKVIRRPYSQFAAAHVDDSIWHARLKNRPAEDRHAMAIEAAKYVGRPYDFWNFNLNNDAGFYCSKLVWLAAWRALKLTVDGNPNPRRSLWFSPKQLLRQPTLDVLVSPGPYLT